MDHSKAVRIWLDLGLSGSLGGCARKGPGFRSLGFRDLIVSLKCVLHGTSCFIAVELIGFRKQATSVCFGEYIIEDVVVCFWELFLSKFHCVGV